MPQTVLYSPTKLTIMAGVCGLLLPLLSPVMLLTGPGAIVLIPLLLFGGPVCAVACLVRLAGRRPAVEVGPRDLTLRTLWRTVGVPVTDLVEVRLVQDTVRLLWVIPVAKKLHLAFVLQGGLTGSREIRLPLNLMDLDAPRAAALAREVSAGVAARRAQPL